MKAENSYIIHFDKPGIDDSEVLERIPSARLEPVFGSDRFFAVRRQPDNHVLGVVSGEYKLVQHIEAYDMAKKVLTDAEPHKVGVGAGGANVTFYFKGRQEVNINSDVHFPYIGVTNGITGQRTLGFKFGFFRLVCSNGQMVGHTLLQLSWKHFKSSLDLNQVRKGIEAEQVRIRETIVPWFNRLAGQPGEPAIGSMLRLVDSSKEQQVRLPLPLQLCSKITRMDKKSTMWDVYNRITSYITHDVRSAPRQDTITKMAEKWILQFVSKN